MWIPPPEEQEAIDFVNKTIPDGIILDLMMPDIDGFQVLNIIRSKNATRKIPALILTAKDLTAQDLRELKGNSVQQLLQKEETYCGKPFFIRYV